MGRGSEGGTSFNGEILMIASYSSGQALIQESHLTHRAWSITFILLLGSVYIASVGQLPTQASQPRAHLSGKM